MLNILIKINQLLNREQKKKLLILFFMMVVGAFLEVLGVSLMVPLMSAIMQPDIIESNELIHQVCDTFAITSHRTFVIVCIVSLIIVFIVKDLYLMLQYYLQNRFVYNNQFATQKKLMRIFLHRPYEYFLSAKTGDIIRIVRDDVGETYILVTTLLKFATESIVSIAMIIAIFIVDPLMTCFLAIMMLVVVIVITKIIKPILHKEGLALHKYSGLTYGYLLQAIDGIKEVKVTQKEDFFENKYIENGSKLINTGKIRSVLSAFPRLLIEMVSVSSMLALIAILIICGRDIESLIPSIAAFAMAALKLMPSANRIVSAINSVAFYEPALDQMLKHLTILEQEHVPVSIRNHHTNSTLSFGEELCLKDLTYTYPNTNTPVLDQVNMVIPVGKTVGIIGKSGAGKTTVVDVVLGLLKPQSGAVMVDGKNVMKSYDEWLSLISYIPQSIFMMDDTIRANVAFGVEEEEITDEKVWHALEEAQIADFVRTLPEGINTQIGEHGVRLSGGQRQRIGIARALYSNPELLIFDEATSSLDNETEAAVMDSINHFHGKKTMIIIAHRLETIKGCDFVYRVVDGKIVQDR